MSVRLQLIYQYGSMAWQYACLCENCEQGGPSYCLDGEIYFEKKVTNLKQRHITSTPGCCMTNTALVQPS